MANHSFFTALLSAGLFLVLNSIADKWGYFHVDSATSKKLRLSDVVAVFFIFIAVEFVVFPAFAYLWISMNQGHFLSSSSFESIYRETPWLPIAGIIFGCLTPIIYNLFTKKIEFGKLSRLPSDISLALVSWILAFPAAVTISNVVEGVASWFGYVNPPDQAAVQLFKESADNPALFFRLLATVVFLVPVAEELLFRGYLQGYLMGRTTRWKAIMLTSLLFVLFHISPNQGVTNITVMLSLFPLSCYLGHLREKQQSLWAPIALHATFNSISILMLAAQG